MSFNPHLDLEFNRDVPISVAQIWEGWTNPDILMKWFCPRPWRVVECEIDLRPGGVFRNIMQSPEGINMPENLGTYLLVEPLKQLVWTNVLLPGFRPNLKNENEQQDFQFVVDLKFKDHPNGGANYHAHVMHKDEMSRQLHEEMGFEKGWGIALDQLVELMQSTYPNNRLVG